MVFSAARAGKGARQQWGETTGKALRLRKSLLVLFAFGTLAGLGAAMLAYFSVAL